MDYISVSFSTKKERIYTIPQFAKILKKIISIIFFVLPLFFTIFVIQKITFIIRLKNYISAY